MHRRMLGASRERRASHAARATGSLSVKRQHRHARHGARPVVAVEPEASRHRRRDVVATRLLEPLDDIAEVPEAPARHRRTCDNDVQPRHSSPPVALPASRRPSPTERWHRGRHGHYRREEANSVPLSFRPRGAGGRLQCEHEQDSHAQLGRSARPGAPGHARDPAGRRAGRPVPRVAARRELHVQLLLPAVAELDAVGARVGAGRPIGGRGDGRLHLARRPRERRRGRADLRGDLPLVPRLVAGRALDRLHGGPRRGGGAARDPRRGHRGGACADRRRPDLRRPRLLSRRDPRRLRGHDAERLLQRVHPADRRGPVGRGGDRGHPRQRLRPQPALLRPLGHAHHPGLAAGRQRAAPGLEPEHPAGFGPRPARARARRRHRRRNRGAPGADALPHAARRGERRPALRLLVDERRRRPVQQPLRATHGRRRTLQDHLLPARRVPPAVVAGRRVDRVHHQRGRAAAARAAGDARRRPAHRDHRTPALEAADGHPVRHHAGRRDRRADRLPHPPDGVRRQVLRSRRRLRARRRTGRSRVPPHRAVHAWRCPPGGRR